MDISFLATEQENIDTGTAIQNRQFYFYLESIDRTYYSIYGSCAVNVWLLLSLLALYIEEGGGGADYNITLTYETSIKFILAGFLVLLVFLLYIYSLVSNRSRYDFNQVSLNAPDIGQGKNNAALRDIYGKNGKLLAATARNTDGSNICINSQCCPNDPSSSSSSSSSLDKTTNPYWDPVQNKCILSQQSSLPSSPPSSSTS